MIKYQYKKGKFLKNGHTMFEADVLTDLKRLAYLEEEKSKQLILNGVSKRFFVVEEMNSQDMEIISTEFTDIEDAKGFIETMKNGYTYKNSNLTVINVF